MILRQAAEDDMSGTEPEWSDADSRLYRELAGSYPHVQIAGTPGRHEPDVGEINYPYLFDLFDEIGYDGWIGCEYRPKGDTVAGLGWATRYGIG